MKQKGNWLSNSYARAIAWMNNSLKKVIICILIVFLVGSSCVPVNQVFAYYNEDWNGNAQSSTPDVGADEITDPTSYDSEYDPKNVAVLEEIVEKRSANTKTFQKADGSYAVAVYDHEVHFSKNGEWCEIDNSLSHDDKSDSYFNKANSFSVQLPNTFGKGKKASISLDDYSVRWEVINSADSKSTHSDPVDKKQSWDEVINISSEILYKNVFPKVDLEYILVSNGVKENIILSEYIKDYSISFTYETKNLSLEKNPDDTYFFSDKDGKAVFSFGDLVMYDSNEAQSEKIDLVVQEIASGKYLITLKPNDQWLQNATYPVIVDPTISTVQSKSAVDDTYVDQVYPTSNYGANSRISLGGTTALNQKYALLKIALPEEIYCNYITYATLSMKQSLFVSNQQMNVFRNLSAFIESGSGGTTWNTKPTCYEFADDFLKTTSSVSTYYFDVTSSVRYWQTHPNYGWTIKANNVNLGTTKMYSADSIYVSYYPQIVIGYTETPGIKDYWTYDTQSLGSAGTGFIAENSGTYMNVRNDLAYSNERTALSLSFTYSLDDWNQDLGYGVGWRSNYDITLGSGGDSILFGDWSETDYLGFVTVYDPGTNAIDYVYFVSENGDGSLLIIDYVNGSSTDVVYIRTKDGTKFFFDPEIDVISSVETKDGKILTISRDSSGRIDRIYDELGNYIQMEYYLSNHLKFSRLFLYDADSQTEKQVEYISYYYNADGTLDYVARNSSFLDNSSTFVTQNVVSYGYNAEGRMNSFEAMNTGERVVYSILAGTTSIGTVLPYRVFGYSLYNGTYNRGAVTFSYNTSYTIKQDVEGNQIKCVFDQYGHTISLHDDKGSSKYYKYLDNYSGGNVNYYLSNKVIAESPSLNLQTNLIANGQFSSPTYVSQGVSGGWYQLIDSRAGTMTYSNTALNSNPEYSINRIRDMFDPLCLMQTLVLDVGIYSLHARIYNPNDENWDGYGASISVSGASIIGEIPQVYSSYGYVDVAYDFTVSSNNTSIIICLENQSIGNALFDDVSIEYCSPNEQDNLITNFSFEDGVTGWTFSTAPSIVLSHDVFMGEALGYRAARFSNVTDLDSSMQQFISTSYADGDMITFGCWMKGQLSTQNDQAYAKVTIQLRYHDANNVDHTYSVDESVEFYSNNEGWQYGLSSTQVDITNMPGFDSAIGIDFIVTFRSENPVEIDGAQLFSEEIFTYQTYNLLGNYSTSYLPGGIKKTFIYSLDELNQIESIVEEDSMGYSSTDSFEFSSSGKLEELTAKNMTVNYTYDTQNSEVLTNVRVASLSGDYYSNSTNYSNNYQFVSGKTDSYGNTTSYDYNGLTALLDNIGLPSGDVQYCVYDLYGRLQSTYINNNLGLVSYGYDSVNRITSITVHGLVYTIQYNDLDQNVSVQLDGLSLVSYDYEEKIINQTVYHTDRLKSQTYAMGNIFDFTYTEDGQLSSVSYRVNASDTTPELRFEYSYDIKGALRWYVDHVNGNQYFYSYYFNGLIKSVTDQDGHSTNYAYDDQGNLADYSYSVNNISRTTHYNVDHENRVLDSVQYEISSGNQVSVDYQYGSSTMLRLAEIIIARNNSVIMSESIFYDDEDVVVDTGDSGLSLRPNSIVYFGTDGYDSWNYTLDYEYDTIGNILAETMTYNYFYYDGEDPYTEVLYHHSYEYDSLNQLARENYCESGCSLLTPTGFTKTFAYDSHGNRTLTNRYAYTTGSLDGKPILSSFSFLYGNSWDDQLTSAFGFTYTYDAQGNVLTMVNTLSGISISYGWEGRTLVYYHYVDTVNNIDKVITYKYDDQGYRTEKIVNGVLHQYYLDGARVLVEKFGSNVLYYTYSADGTLLSANINGQEYFYQRNLLGDIIGLYDINGDLDVTYEYDAWGNLLSLNDYSGSNVGTLNPYRYRGYRFDADMGLYYLTSRYYNPQTGRFINADGNIGKIGQTLSHNMYAYCANNPVMYTDSDGYMPQWLENVLIGAAIIVTVAAISALIITSGGTAAAFLPAFGAALQTGFTIAGVAGGVAGTIRAGRSLSKHLSDGDGFEDTVSGMGKSFLAGFGDGFLAGAEYYAVTSIVSFVGFNASGLYNNGFGYSNTTFMMGYQNPSVSGFTIFASLIGNKFRIDIDPLHSLHYHSGSSNRLRNIHRGAWFGGVIVGIIEGFSGEVY